MNKIQNILLSILIVALAGVIGVFLIPRLIKNSSHIAVQTSHPASLYIDGKYMGKAPTTIPVTKSGVVLRLVPDESTLGEFQERVEIGKNTTSNVKVYFSSESNLSSSSVSYYEKIAVSDVEISVVSLPNLARLKVDDQVRGFTPVKLNTTLGRHDIEVSFDGYFSQKFEIETKEGYRIISIVKLAKDINFIPTTLQEVEVDLASPLADPKILVEILETPTGFLRVRKEPNTSSQELGQVRQGETYELLDGDTNPDWYQIQFTGDVVGWLSSKYVKVVEPIQP